ncbi:hypothetical protein GCM10022278_25510 [Allohahella marinimesophila]|uniref:Uncharacterized protein n=1 Tax=Allohahella marinimesophila TaxID=1054972 RepID=A0ABP7PJ44_9GAMM
MDGDGVSDFGRTDDGRDIEVAERCRVGADTNGFVGEPDVHQVAVNLRMDRYGLNAEFLAGPKYSKCNFTAVRDKHFFDFS